MKHIRNTFWHRFWERLALPLKMRSVREAAGIYPTKEFRRVLERERSLAFRHGRLFSLVIFSMNDDDADPLCLRALTGMVVERLRKTDVAGWVDWRRVGVILPETAEEGARIVADDLCQKVAAVAQRPHCAIYTFPSGGRDRRDGGRETPQRRPVEKPTVPVPAFYGSSASMSAVGLNEPAMIQPAVNVYLYPPGESPRGRDPQGRHQLTLADHDVTCTVYAPTANSALLVDLAAPAAAPATQAKPTDRSIIGDESNQVMGKIIYPRYPWWKRAIDLIAAAVALVVATPAMLLITLLIKTVSRGPVLFRQERVGLFGKRFVCFKFRTMHLQADTKVHKQYFNSLMEGEAPMTKLDAAADPRLIPFGGFLRASGLDELPQIFNILRGDMSIIGPRPCIPYEYENYRRWQKRRSDAMPGVTGLWQVSGKNKTTFKQMMRLDIAYAQRKSFWKDVLILFKTTPVILDQVLQFVRGRKQGRA